jgi:hypothetical protein
MSFQKQNTTLPDTLRTFENNTDAYKLTESLFITPDDFSFTEAEFINDDHWYSELGINIFPLHGVNEFASKDTETKYVTSLQDFDYKINSGKYKHEFRYDWSLDYHKLINEISGQKVKVIYRSGNVLRATTDGTSISGFTIETFELEKMLFNNGDSVGNSKLFLEWMDSDELNVYGYEAEVDWNPGKMNRLVLNINLSFSTDLITMQVRYLNNPISNISSSDITITDELNGDVGFGVFVPGNGIYQLGDFTKTITRACIYIQSTLYIGAKRFTYNVVVTVEQNLNFINGDNWELISGENLNLINKTA